MQEETMVHVTFKVDGYGASRELDIVTPDGAVFSVSHSQGKQQPTLNEFRELVKRQNTIKVNLKEDNPQEFITYYSAIQYQFPLKDLGYDFHDYMRRHMRDIHFRVPSGGNRPDSTFYLI